MGIVMDYMTVAAGLSSRKWGGRLLKTATGASAEQGKSLSGDVLPISIISGLGNVVIHEGYRKKTGQPSRT